MPQIAMVQSAAPRMPPPGPPADNDTQSFSPHLDKAMAARKDKPSSRENINKPSQEKPSEAQHGLETADSKETVKTSPDGTPTEGQSADQVNDIIHAASVEQTDTSTLPSVLGHPRDDTSVVFQFLTNSFTNKIDDTGGKQTAFAPQVLPYSSAGVVVTPPLADTMNLAVATPDTLALSIPVAGEKPESNALLLELQKIIENSNESGTVTITVSDKAGKTEADASKFQTAMATAVSEPLPIATTSGKFAESQVDEQMVVLPAGAELPADKANQNLTSTRHSIRQQYYEGKISLENKQESETPSEESPQNNTFPSKTAQTANENTTSALNPNQPSTFAQPLALVQEAQKPTTAEGSPPVTLPSGIVVQQEDLIRQIAEHLQISRRDNDTKVNIQLHPAELGELKISLSVKEGSVRANVVASSQYAQEIIEKNMTKLRSVLENQGFTIGEMSITCKSDTSGDFNLFDRQLFSQNDYTPPSAKNTRPTGALFIVEDPGAREQTAETGVNVKI